jgi:hypothetical protein|uniref:Uncharacterized protein n=1 Tax=Siphoviridae sp. ctHEr2 TaxID=2826229 RepID=A0A8S5NEE3_9CAUD|nr:MAG TPA: hypothetical protein [Siphoviridae sp. ctHEr2]
MDLSMHIDYLLPRLSRRAIRKAAYESWGRPSCLRNRFVVRLIEIFLSAAMPKPKISLVRTEDGSEAEGYPVIYHGEHLLIMPMSGIRCVRTYVLCGAMKGLLKR